MPALFVVNAALTELIGQLRLERFTDRTITDSDELLEQVRQVRRLGYAMSFGERVQDGAALAAPVLNQLGEAIAALAVIAPAHRTTRATLDGWIPLVLGAAREIAAAYGAVPPARAGRAAAPTKANPGS